MSAEVIAQLTSEMFNDVDDIPMIDDDRHAFFCADSDDDLYTNSVWSNIMTEDEMNDSEVDGIRFHRSFFIFDQSCNPHEQYVAIRKHVGLDGLPPLLPKPSV